MTKNTHTILLVEDEEIMRVTLQGALEEAGLKVLCAADGEEGLKMALEHHPALVLTDLQMPKMGGLEMIRTIRQDAWGAGVEIIILTNISDAAALETAMQEGAFFYMVKSDSSMADVVAKVKSRLK
jgi:CheY-like chemotaxis protein